MKRRRHRLPIPQHEFGFTPDAFNLIQDTALDGDRLSRELVEAQHRRQLADSAQARLFAQPSTLNPQLSTRMNSVRLRPGDIIRHDGQPCPVLRVNDCAAVIAVTKPPREFTTLFGVRVRIQPKPVLVRISPPSEVPILNR